MASANLYSTTDVGDVIVTNFFDANHNVLNSTVLTNGGQYGGGIQVAGTWTNWYDDKDNLLGTKIRSTRSPVTHTAPKTNCAPSPTRSISSPS
jgi:hypothetical protein